VAVLAGAGVAAALTLIPSTGAQAAVTADFAAAGYSSATYTGSDGGTCELTAGQATSASHPVTMTHGTKRRSVDLRATYANSLDSSEKAKVKGHLDGTLTIKRKHHDLRVVDLGVKGRLEASRTPGSKCRATGELVAGITNATFTEHKKGWFYLTRDTGKARSLVEFAIVNVKTGRPVVLTTFAGRRSHETSRAKLRPGTYAIEEAEAGLYAGLAFAPARSGATEKATLDVHLHGRFAPLTKKHR
jgi:hypothetical protein